MSPSTTSLTVATASYLPLSSFYFSTCSSPSRFSARSGGELGLPPPAMIAPDDTSDGNEPEQACTPNNRDSENASHATTPRTSYATTLFRGSEGSCCPPGSDRGLIPSVATMAIWRASGGSCGGSGSRAGPSSGMRWVRPTMMRLFSRFVL